MSFWTHSGRVAIHSFSARCRSVSVIASLRGSVGNLVDIWHRSGRTLPGIPLGEEPVPFFGLTKRESGPAREAGQLVEGVPFSLSYLGDNVGPLASPALIPTGKHFRE